jgi:hypothetical protein
MGDLTINELAKKIAVSRWTIYKLLSPKNPKEAVIPKKDWYKLPGGGIRIKKSVVKKLQGGK